MATKKIDDFTAVTAASGTDVALVSQGGVTKKLPLSLIPIPVATQTALDLKAPSASPAFTGTPVVPTAASGANTTQAASTAFVKAAIDALVAGAPGALDTLKEIADQLGNDETAAAALTGLVNARAIVATATLTGTGTLTGSARNTLDATGGAFTATLPAPAKIGQLLLAERIDTSSNTITIAAATGATLRGDSAGTVALPGVGAAFESLLFVAESLTSWAPAAGHKPKKWLDTLYAPVRRTLSPRLGVLGDSLSQNGDVALASRGNSPLFWACLVSGGRLLYSYMGGVSGQTSTQIAARAADAAASNAETFVVLMGTNDGAGTGPFATTKANLDSTVATLLAAGKTVLLATMPPRGTSSNGPSASQQTFIATYNTYVRRLAARLGTPIVDYYSIFVDTAGDYWNSTYQGDGVHPTANSAIGWRAMGLAIYNALAPHIPLSSSALPTVNTDRASLIGNNLFLTGGGGTAYPTGWSGQTSGYENTTVSTVAGTLGNNLRLTMANNASQKLLTRENIAVIPGRRLQIVFEAAWSGCRPTLQVDYHTSAGMTYGAFKPVAAPDYDQTTPVPFVSEYTVPAGVDYINLTWVVPGGVANGWMQLGRPAIYDLTALGIDGFVIEQ